MIKENQKLFNRLNRLTDGIIVALSLLIAFGVRFGLMEGGSNAISREQFLVVELFIVPIQLVIYQLMGLYESFRREGVKTELLRLFYATAMGFLLLLMGLFWVKVIDFSRLVLILFLGTELCLLGGKRIGLRYLLRYYRAQGYNQKHVLLVGCGTMASRYRQELRKSPQLGYQIMGYLSNQSDRATGLRCLGNYGDIDKILDTHSPDEVIIALEVSEYEYMECAVAACEKAGVKVSIIPFFAQYFRASPQIDFVGSVPAINLRRVPLENLGNAAWKRCMDIVGASVLLVITSPLLLITAVGVKLSSPGPILFKQTRVGLDRREFQMYKFRSMRVNTTSDSAWSQNRDPRKTKVGAFIRKCSIDELPQLYNVLRGDMSLVGPRPELPHFVEQFKEEIPLYMVKHQVRPGITGWAQVNGLRGDTSIPERIRHDIDYIEQWSLWMDIQILFLTLFKGVINDEALKTTEDANHGKETATK